MPEDLVGFFLMPALFVFLKLAGVMLALVNWRRYPAACALLLTASLLYLSGTAAHLPARWLIDRGELDPWLFGMIMAGVSIVNWTAYALMILAVFAGRNDLTANPFRPSQSDSGEW